jgi:hypothetical protein
MSIQTIATDLDTLETLDETHAPRPRVDLLSQWFDETLPLEERKQARRLFFGAQCERGTHRMSAQVIRPGRFATRDNPMVGEPLYYRVDRPRRACDIHGSGRIFEYTSRREEFEVRGEVRKGFVVDVYDLGLNAQERELIGVVRNEGVPFMNEQDAFAAVLGAGGTGWLQLYWDAQAEKFRQSEAGKAQLAKIEAHYAARDEAMRLSIAQWAKYTNDLAAYGNAQKANDDLEGFRATKQTYLEAKATHARLVAEYDARPLAPRDEAAF